MTRPTLKEFEFAFVSSDAVLPECPVAVHIRFELIWDLLPMARGRPLHADMTDVFQWALHNATGDTLSAAYDLAVLVARYWGHLHLLGYVHKGATHVNYENAHYWIDLLGAQRAQVTKPRIKKGRLRSAQWRDPVKPVWVN